MVSTILPTMVRNGSSPLWLSIQKGIDLGLKRVIHGSLVFRASWPRILGVGQPPMIRDLRC